MNKMHDQSSIEAAAHALRSQLDIKDQAAPDFRDILTKLRQLLPNTKVKIVSAENASALAWTDSKTLYVQKIVADGLARGDAHARYVIAHELGHIVLNHQAVSNRHSILSPHLGPQRQEMEAALFANALLLPPSLVKRYQSANEIGEAFQASVSNESTRVAELYSAADLPLAPATQASADIIGELTDLGYSEGEISDLVVPKRTLARRRADHEPLTIEETDKALRLYRIAKQAFRVFGDPAKAHRWLRKPKHALNGNTPVAFLASEEGARKVEEMLHRIDYGMAA